MIPTARGYAHSTRMGRAREDKQGTEKFWGGEEGKLCRPPLENLLSPLLKVPVQDAPARLRRKLN